MTVTLVPINGALATIAKVESRNPSAARSLLRFSLFDAAMCQADELEARITPLALEHMASVNKVARVRMLRRHVGKAIEGEPEPDDLKYAEALGVLDEWVEKGMLSSALNTLFNRQHPRDESGRFTTQNGARSGAINVMTGFSSDEGRARDTKRADRMAEGAFNGDTVRSGSRGAEQWHGATQGENRQAYNRLQMTGDALTRMSQKGSAVHAAGTVAQFAGTVGPEAERVLGPSIRRTAYRYRGTEKTPDAEIRANVDDANTVALAMNGKATAPGSMARANALIGGKATPKRPDGGGRPSQDVTAALYQHHKGGKGDQVALQMRGDAAVASLLGVGQRGGESHLPDMELVQLSIESGEMPPSEGIIIGQNGKVLTQSVGYNGDHYLPFDLSNLEGMGGGQYVRTRATGGLTGEDIYTSMAAGVRQAQVVSNSGVFTLEFDPSFRGARRHNDKARRMIERYATLLGAIDNPGSKLFTSDISRGEQQKIRQEVARVARSQDDFKTLFDQRMDEARLRSQGSGASHDDIVEAAGYKADADMRTMDTAAMSSQQRARTREELVNEHIDEAYETGEGAPVVQRMKLDGEGYYQAMRALKQEFPYYIRTATYEPLKEWLADRDLDAGENRRKNNRTADVGYTEAGQTNARRTRMSEGGKTGFRSARTVPTEGRRRQPSAEGESKTPAPDASAERKAAVPPASGASLPDDERVVSVSELAERGAPYARKLGLALGPALKNMALANPAGEPVPAENSLDRTSGADWGQLYVFQQQDQNGANAANAIARQVLEDTDGALTAKLRTALEAYAQHDFSNRYADDDANQIRSTTKAALAEIDRLELIRRPFDPRPIEDAILDGFDARGRPPAVGDVERLLGAPDSAFASEIGHAPPQVREAYERLEDAEGNADDDPTQIMESARHAYLSAARSGVPEDERAERASLHDTVRAWALLTARKASRELRSALEVGGGGVPKEAAPVPEHRKHATSVFDKARRRRVVASKSLSEPEWVAAALRALDL